MVKTWAAQLVQLLAQHSVAQVVRPLQVTNVIVPNLLLAVPSVVVVESVTGDPGRDANTNRFLKTCDLITEVPESTARCAARLRFLAKTGSAVDALVVATAEPGGQVLTGDPGDLRAVAAPAECVRVVDI